MRMREMDGLLMFKVIFADDEINIRQGLAKAVQWDAHGFVIAGTAADGLEARDLYMREKPHLVITDILMPEMDGLELTRVLKKDNPLVKIIIISGYSDFTYAREAIKYGVTDYLLKPLDFRELGAVLDSAWKSIEVELQGNSRIPDEWKEPDNTAVKADGKLADVLAYVRENYHNDINLIKLADHFFFSPVYLGQLFKKETGRYFHEYINWLRVEMAKKLIEEGTGTMEEISSRVGYKNVDHFYKNFKKATGINPGDYKKRVMEFKFQ